MTATCFNRALLLLLVLTSVSSFAQKRKTTSSAPAAPSVPIKLVVDATHVAQKILHAELQITATPGPLTLVYPKWIPGEHGPTGPLTDLTGLEFFAGGKRLTWRRDLVDMFALHLDVPQGAKSVEVRLDLVMPAPPEGFSSGASATTQLAVVSWNQVVLYPAKTRSDDVLLDASLKLPAGWHYGTALPVANESPQQINFRQVNLTTLVDSPVLAGAHFRRVALSPQGPIQHYIDIAADSGARDAAAYHRRVQEPDCRDGSTLWSAPLSRISLPADAERSHRPFRSGAPRIKR